MEMDCKGGDNGGRNTKPDQADFIDVGTLSEDSRFTIKACTVQKGVKRFQG